MHIALVCNEYPPRPHGGIGTFVHQHARDLVRSGHSVTVVGLGAKREEWRDGEVSVVILPESRWRLVGWLLSRFRVHRFLHRLARREGLDVIEVPDFQGMLPFRVPWATVVVRLHQSTTAMTMAAGQRIRRGTRWAERATLRRHRSWVCVSRHAAEITAMAFPGVVPDRWAFIRSPLGGADTAELDGMEAPKRFVLFAGHVSEQKGALELARAANTFLRQHGDVELLFAGAVRAGADGNAGRLCDALIQDVVDSGLRERVRCLGFVPRAQLLGLMRRAAAFVFPSRLETFGLVVAEAMQQGCPVVVRNAPPFTEFVEHERTGILVGEGPTALAAGVERLLADAEFAAQIAKEGKRRICQLMNNDDQVKASIAFYEECIQAERAG